VIFFFVLNEAEAQNKRELDHGELGVERKLYYRELIARFGHHPALEWNLCEEYNLDLSARRAGSVVNYFIKKGVEASRLEWVGHGEARPIHPNDSEDQKEANRRVEFRILNTAEILGE
jgi:hypothetical protein